MVYKKKVKKAQIKFGETFGVIIIVYIIIMSGLIWFNNVNNKSIKESYLKDAEARSFEKYQYIINLNLIHDSQKGDIDEIFNLISLRTFENFSKTKNGSKFLFNRLSFSTITLNIYNRSVFDSINNTNYEINLTLYNRTPNINRKIIAEPIYKTLIPIRDPIRNENLIGLLSIKSYVLGR